MMIENPYVISEPMRAKISRVQGYALIIGAICMVLTLAQWLLNPVQFYRSWMIGFMYAFGAGLGALACLMLQYMTGGGWGMLVRRQLEAGSRTIPYLTILFIPICFALFTHSQFYEWLDPAKIKADAVIREKSAYLNPTWWLIRTAAIFIIWNVYQFILNRLSGEEERTGDIRISKRLMGFSGIGLVIYALTLTSAAVDWIMSMNVHWFSTIYGLILLATEGLTIISTVIITTTLLMREPPMVEVVKKRHLHDLGKLLFMFTLFWTYVSFSQLVIMWSGNLPEEVSWYIARMNGGWGLIAVLLVFFQWMFPFLILLSQDIKRNPKTVRFMAIWILTIRAIDVIWQVEPNFHPQSLFISWSDITAILGFAGVWIFLYLNELKKRPLLAVNAADFVRYLEYVPAK
jgi:hypothetical protein